MNREKTAEAIFVMQAYNAGTECECRLKVSSTIKPGKWITMLSYEEPSWNFATTEYRIKPQPREFTLEPTKDAGRYKAFELNTERAFQFADYMDGAIKVREVLDD